VFDHACSKNNHPDQHVWHHGNNGAYDVAEVTAASSGAEVGNAIGVAWMTWMFKSSIRQATLLPEYAMVKSGSAARASREDTMAGLP